MILHAIFTNNQNEVTTGELFQWDTGQQLCIEGLTDIDENTEVHFANNRMSQAIVKTGTFEDNALTVDIPNEFLQSGGVIHGKAWVYVTESETVGQTIKTINIPIVPRTRPNDYVSPTDPDSKGIVEQALEILRDGTKVSYVTSATVSNATETGKVYYTTVGSSKALIVPVSGNSSQVQFRLDRDGKIYSRRREKRNGAYPEWGSFADIAAGVDPEVVRQIVENYISEQGIAEAVEDYLDANPTMVLKYDTVSEMLEAGLTVDHIIVTAGYHSPNDGGGAMYKIVETTERFAETLENGLKAELIIEGGCKNARQFGACGDNITDDTAALQAWLNDVAVNGGYAYLPKGHYVITAPITIDWSHNGELRRNFLQKIVGDGCTSYETGYDNSVIIARGIAANRGALEFISDGNTWGTQVQISDIGIYCDSTCDPMSFCLFYGDSRHLALDRVKMKGYNDILVRCGSKVTEGVVSSSYEHICCTIEHCDLITRGTKGFAMLPESVLVQNAYSMLDTLSLRDSFIGGVFAVHCNNFSAESCTVTIEGIKNRLVTDDNAGKLNGYQIDYATGFLIIETASTIIKNTYFEDFKRGIDVAPICGNIRSVLIEGCYFNPGSNQYDNNNQLIKSDYGVLIRSGKPGSKVAHAEVSHNVFRHDETQSNIVKFNVAAVQNDFSEEIIVYANAGRPNSNADQIYSTYGVSAIDAVFTNVLRDKVMSDYSKPAGGIPASDLAPGVIPSVPTKTSELTNDSGFLTQHQDISGKVDKVTGKGLSTNDYTTAEKNKLASLEPGNSIWKTSTAPTEPDAPEKPGYGFTISSLTGANRDVQLGDMILYSYYYYTVTAIIDSVAYAETRVSIRGAKGSTGAKGDPGDDYVLTAQDKTEIANIVIGNLPIYNGGVQ